MQGQDGQGERARAPLRRSHTVRAPWEERERCSEEEEEEEEEEVSELPLLSRCAPLHLPLHPQAREAWPPT